MKNILIVTGCAMLLCLSTIAYSADGPYVSGHVGYVIATDSEVTDPGFAPLKMDVESDGGYALAGALGFAQNELRGEVEIAYQKNDLDKATLSGAPLPSLSGDITNFSVLVNGYYDIDTGSEFTPFVSVGLGFAKVEIDEATGPTNEDDTVFAYQFGGGLGYAVDGQVTIDIKYRYFATTEVEFDTSTAEYATHNFTAGVRYSF